MIYTHRTQTPSEFLKLKARIKQLDDVREWLALPAENRPAPPNLISRFHQFPEVGEAIMAEFHHKCAICERKLKPGEGRLSFFRPLGGALPFHQGSMPDPYYYFWLVWDWSNLTYTCRECLDNQLGHFPVATTRVSLEVDHLDRENARPYFIAECPLILDPSVEVPAKHLEFNERGGVEALSDSDYGQQTIDLFKLNRPSLRSARMEDALHLKSLWLQAYEATLYQQSSRLTKLQGDLLTACASSEQFAGMKRQLLLRWVHDKRKAIETPEGIVNALGQATWQETVNRIEQMTYPIDALLRVDSSSTFAIRELTRLYNTSKTAQDVTHQVTIILGDVIHGDKIIGDQLYGDKVVVGNIEGSHVVLGRNSRLTMTNS